MNRIIKPVLDKKISIPPLSNIYNEFTTKISNPILVRKSLEKSNDKDPMMELKKSIIVKFLLL